MDRTQDNAQKKYRQKQAARGISRFEIQIPTELKQQFDALVEAVAEEYVKPYSQKQRIARARIQVFHEITQHIRHDFFELKDKIQSLQEEINALSPQFFKTDLSETTPLPQAIQALPDAPNKLKRVIAKLFQTLQSARLQLREQKRLADQYQKLYEVADQFNTDLKQRMRSLDEHHY